jgi:hypothetical protein
MLPHSPRWVEATPPHRDQRGPVQRVRGRERGVDDGTGHEQPQRPVPTASSRGPERAAGSTPRTEGSRRATTGSSYSGCSRTPIGSSPPWHRRTGRYLDRRTSPRDASSAHGSARGPSTCTTLLSSVPPPAGRRPGGHSPVVFAAPARACHPAMARLTGASAGRSARSRPWDSDRSGSSARATAPRAGSRSPRRAGSRACLRVVLGAGACCTTARARHRDRLITRLAQRASDACPAASLSIRSMDSAESHRRTVVRATSQSAGLARPPSLV